MSPYYITITNTGTPNALFYKEAPAILSPNKDHARTYEELDEVLCVLHEVQSNLPGGYTAHVRNDDPQAPMSAPPTNE